MGGWSRPVSTCRTWGWVGGGDAYPPPPGRTARRVRDVTRQRGMACDSSPPRRRSVGRTIMRASAALAPAALPRRWVCTPRPQSATRARVVSRRPGHTSCTASHRDSSTSESVDGAPGKEEHATGAERPRRAVLFSALSLAAVAAADADEEQVRVALVSPVLVPAAPSGRTGGGTWSGSHGQAVVASALTHRPNWPRRRLTRWAPRRSCVPRS